MCTTVWTPEGRDVGSQYEFGKLVCVPVKRLPLVTRSDGLVSYTDRSLMGRCCLCPIDIGKALSDAGFKWHQDDCGDYVIDDN